MIYFRYSGVEISFDQFQIKTNENYVAYKLQNLIAEFGGLLGLFMGCSVLSLIELLYFCFTSIIVMNRKQQFKGRKKKKKHQQILPVYSRNGLWIMDHCHCNKNIQHIDQDFNVN